MEHTVIYKRVITKGAEDMIPVGFYECVNRKSFMALNLSERPFEQEVRPFGLGNMLQKRPSVEG